MTHSVTSSLTIALACSSLLACGNPPPTTMDKTPDQACSDLATAQCGKRQSCTNGANINRVYGDMATCVSRSKNACLASNKANGSGLTVSQIASCVAAYPSFSCADFFNGNPPAACVATGTLDTDAPCAFNGQCKSTYCAIPRGTACGKCAAPPTVGSSCATNPCGRNQSCSSGGMLCQTPGALDAPCDAKTNPCGFDLSCVGATMAAMGTCKTEGTMSGTACDGSTKTAASCDIQQGWQCNSMTKMCAALKLVAGGAMCGRAASGDFVLCSAGGQCVFAAMSAMGTCVAPAAEGGVCDTAVGPPCMVPAKCVTGGGTVTAGTCQLEDASKCT